MRGRLVFFFVAVLVGAFVALLACFGFCFCVVGGLKPGLVLAPGRFSSS